MRRMTSLGYVEVVTMGSAGGDSQKVQTLRRLNLGPEQRIEARPSVISTA